MHCGLLPFRLLRLIRSLIRSLKPTSPRALADAIVASGLFPLPPGAGDSLASGQAAEPVAPPLDVAKKVALIGTVFGQQGGIMAILEDLPTKKQSLYRMGEQIPTVGALSAIEKNRVLFREGKQEEWLDLALTQLPHPLLSGVPATATSAPVPHPSAPQRRILDRREIDAALADTTRLLTQAQAVPYLTDGKLDGFRLYSVMPLGLLRQNRTTKQRSAPADQRRGDSRSRHAAVSLSTTPKRTDRPSGYRSEHTTADPHLRDSLTPRQSVFVMRPHHSTPSLSRVSATK